MVSHRIKEVDGVARFQIAHWGMLAHPITICHELMGIIGNPIAI